MRQEFQDAHNIRDKYLVGASRPTVCNFATELDRTRAPVTCLVFFSWPFL